MHAYLTVPRGGLGEGDAARAVVIDAAGGLDPRDYAAIMRLRTANAPPLVLIGADGAETEGDLAAIVACRPDALVASVAHGRDVADLANRLAVAEAEIGLPDGGIGIVAILNCAAGVLAAGSLVGSSRRLHGLGWDACGLARAIGAAPPTEGAYAGPLAHARALVGLAAAAAGVRAIESACEAGDPDAFAAVVGAARRDGFSAMLARTPAQARLIEGRR